MKIDYNNLSETAIPNFKGGDKEYNVKMHADDLNKIMVGRLTKGASIGRHTHSDSSEIIYVLSGEGIAEIDGVAEIVKAGECHYCPKGSTHSLRNAKDEDLKFFAVVPQQ